MKYIKSQRMHWGHVSSKLEEILMYYRLTQIKTHHHSANISHITMNSMLLS